MALAEDQIKHGVYRQRVIAGKENDVIRLVNQQLRAIRRSMQVYDPSMSQRRFNEMIAALNNELAGINTAAANRLRSELEEFAVMEGEFEYKTLDKNITLNVTLPSPEALAVAARRTPVLGRTSKQVLDTYDRRTRNILIGEIRDSYLLGRTSGEITRRIAGSFRRSTGEYVDGLIDTSRRNAQTVVRTLANSYSQAARRRVWESNKDVIQRLMYVATFDTRTSDICISLHKTFYPVDSRRIPYPPRHPNCRSSLVALVRNEDLSEETRSARGAEGGERVRADMSFDEFLRTQPAEFQDETLGPGRAALFRQGKLSTRDLYNFRRGRTLTLEQLRRKAQ